MDTSKSSASTQFKVGLFALLGLFMVAAMTVLVSNRPFWWKPCQLVKITVDDASGLKAKSPVRSLGIDIGYLKTVTLEETHVTLGICLTAPVQVLPTTRAYLKGEGFLGDKFVELRPVKYLQATETASQPSPVPSEHSSLFMRAVGLAGGMIELLVPSAEASIGDVSAQSENPSPHAPARSRRSPAAKSGEEIPVGEESPDVQHLVHRVDDLVQQISGLTGNLRQAINPDDLKKTMKQLNSTLESASRTLSPESGLNQTAQRTLAKLEDGIEQLRDLMTRVNKGEGSVGMLLNDPVYAQEIHTAIKNLNLLLNKVSAVRFTPDLGAVWLSAFNGARGWFHLGIWPKPNRYYLLGLGSDSRGRVSNTTVSTTVGSGSPVQVTSQVTDFTSMFLTAMMGKVYHDRWDLSVGLLYGDGAISLKYNFGPQDWVDQFQVGTDAYIHVGSGLNARLYVNAQPFKSVYVKAGLEQLPFVTQGSSVSYFVGAGLSFDDEDIKLLFALK